MENNEVSFCTQPWYNLFVSNNGRIQPCCMNSTTLGNINTDDVQQVWNDKPIQKIRELISNHKYEEAGCHKNCNILYHLQQHKQVNMIQKNWQLNEYKEESDFVKNITKFKESIVLKKLITLNSPIYYDIQPIEACNMRCIMCHQNHTNPKKVSVENLKKLFFDLGSLSTVRFQGGEIFLDENFIQFLFDTKEKLSKEQTVIVITNGSMLTSEDLERLTSGASPIQFIVSADGVTEATFKKIRQSSHFQKVFDTIKYLAKLQKEQKRSDLIKWNFVVMKSNFYEIKDAIQLATDLDIEICFQAVIGEKYTEENIFEHKELYEPQMLNFLDEALILCENLKSKAVGVKLLKEKLLNHEKS